jgi:hypothetical protein
MKQAGTDALDNEQKIFASQLVQAVEKLNEASALVTMNHGIEKAAWEAIALSLVAIGKVLVISKAAEMNMVTRLPAFK